MPIKSCPSCGQRKWATRTDQQNFRQRVLRCMECGFEVDARVAVQAKRILKRDDGQDLQVASADAAQGAGE